MESMRHLLEEFVDKYLARITGLFGYDLFARELARCKNHIDYCNVSSRLLSNYYGTYCDARLGMLYRRFMLPLFRPEGGCHDGGTAAPHPA